MQFDIRVESDSHLLLSAMLAKLPDDFGGMLANMIRLNSDDVSQSASKKKIGPLWWAPGVLALCCHAYKQPTEVAVPVGACLQLLGVVAEVLDAIEDGEVDSIVRYLPIRASPESNPDGSIKQYTPVEANHVVAVTTNAAIALIGLTWQALLEYGPQYGLGATTVVKLGGLLADLSIQTCYGQHMDLTTRSTAHSSILSGVGILTLGQYEDLAAVKSGQLGGIVCEVAALLAGAEQHRRIWRDLGTDYMTALQIKDDFTDLEEDLAAGRISHAALFGLEVATPVQGERIMVLLAAGRGSAPGAVNARRELVTMLRAMGADHYILALLAVLRRRMLTTLNALALPPEEHESLSSFILSVAPEYNQPAGEPASTGEQT